MARSDWARFATELKAAGELAVSVVPTPELRGSKHWGGELYPQTWYGSSDDFSDMLRKESPRLMVPEKDIVPLTNSLNWTPEDETATDPDKGPCPKCGGAIDPGSLTYCPKCQASGFESPLAAQRGLAGLPPSEPSRPARAKVARILAKINSAQATRRQRRILADQGIKS